MSKIGNAGITVPSGVTVEITGQMVKVNGPKGSLVVTLPAVISASQQEGMLRVSRANESKHAKSLHGTFRNHIANALHGVTQGWDKRLEVVGTGFTVSMKGKDAIFKVGYSHPVIFPYVEGITFSVEGTNILIVSGMDKQLVGEVAHKARMIKKPDPYKGKGVRYVGEYIKLRPGKKTKAA